MKKLLGLLLLCLIGCDNNQIEKNRVIEIQDSMTHLRYCKDVRTGLCFAGCRLGYQYSVLALVPCSPEVEALIK
jgi:hypothetical protein